MSLFIKFQKARRMIERNGLIGGGKIVGGYLNNYLKAFKVNEGDILFITGGIGDKAHYRAYGVAEELGLHGFHCAVTVADNFRLEKLVDSFKIFIFHKVSHDEKIGKVIAEIKKQNKEIIFDADDLDFDPQYLPYMNYLSQITPEEKEEYENGIGAEILNDEYVKVATTSVSYLAGKLKEKNKKVFLVANKLSEEELEIAEKILKEKSLLSSAQSIEQSPLSAEGEDGNEKATIRIGYYSGTMSHNKDFATIVPALTEVLEKHSNVKLLLAGPLDTHNKLNRFADRIEILPRVARNEYYANVAKCDINIVPLEIGNPFCEAKSEIKFIEAGILGKPTVALKNQTFMEAIDDGVNGFLAISTDEWVQKIVRLIELKKLRLSLGEKAREKVLQDYTNRHSHSEEYYTYLRSVLK